MTRLRSTFLPLIAAALGLLAVTEYSSGQIFPLLKARFQRNRLQNSGGCPGGVCPPVQFQSNSNFSGPVLIETIESSVYAAPTPAETGFAMDVIEAANQNVGEWGRTAARCLVGNSCGSASVCGHKGNEGSYLLSNAHVTGTRPGTQCRLKMRINGQDREFTGRVIMAAYSSKTLTDWAVILTNQKIPVEPRPLSKAKPNGPHVTVGAPRCVWPLVRQDLRTADIADNSPLWRWRPNSISGQSGSGVWSKNDGKQYGLLTWSWGGLGAGQQTSEIYRQALEKSVRGFPRPEGLKEVGRNPDVVIEEGFFVQSGIGDLPIWGDSEKPIDPIPDPIPDMNEEDRRILKILKRLRPKAKEKKIDLMTLIKLIELILELINKNNTSDEVPALSGVFHSPLQVDYQLAC